MTRFHPSSASSVCLAATLHQNRLAKCPGEEGGGGGQALVLGPTLSREGVSDVGTGTVGRTWDSEVRPVCVSVTSGPSLVTSDDHARLLEISEREGSSNVKPSAEH